MVLVPIGSGTTTSASDTEQDTQGAVGDAWKAALEKAQSERSSSSVNSATTAGAPDIIVPPPDLGPQAPPDFGPFGPIITGPFGPIITGPIPQPFEPPSPDPTPHGGSVEPPSPDPTPQPFEPPSFTEPTPQPFKPIFTQPTQPGSVNYAKEKPEAGETGQTGKRGKAGKTKGKKKGPTLTPKDQEQDRAIRQRVLRQAKQQAQQARGEGKSGRSGTNATWRKNAGNDLIHIANDPREQLSPAQRDQLKTWGNQLVRGVGTNQHQGQRGGGQ
jgi:hypothetical protein